MKQRILAGALLVAATISGGSGAWAAGEERPDPGMAGGPGRGPCAKMPPGDHVDHMAKMLGLSETQQKQIKDILKTEHDKNAALEEKMAEYRKQLQIAEQSATFDEAAVRAIAAEQAQTGIELTVSRARITEPHQCRPHRGTAHTAAETAPAPGTGTGPSAPIPVRKRLKFTPSISSLRGLTPTRPARFLKPGRSGFCIVAYGGNYVRIVLSE